MWAIDLVFTKVCARVSGALAWLSVGLVLMLLGGCDRVVESEPPLSIQLYQSWQLQPGDTIAGKPVLGGLGDISIVLDDRPVYAPFNGRLRRAPKTCVVFSSPEVPAYLFRLCGIINPRLGELRRGDPIGNAKILSFAALRKQPNGTWAVVEPSQQTLERTLTPP